MSTESQMQPGTFSSMTKSIELYPHKPFTYFYLLMFLFFFISTVLTIAPGPILMMSSFLVIAPDIVAILSDPGVRIPFIMVGSVMVIYLAYIYWVGMKVKFVLAEDGILYCNSIYHVYSPWENVTGLENTKLSYLSLKGLKLNKEFQQGPRVEEGRQQRFPVFEYTSPAKAKRYASKRADRIASVFPWGDIFPLLGMSNKKRVKKKLAAAFRLYAPHILQHQVK